MQSLNTIPVLCSIAAGGALGSVLRYALSQLITVGVSEGFPTAIMVINIIGSFLMGLFVTLLMARFNDHTMLRVFLTVGVLGGFTTFSTFSLDVVALFERGEYILAGCYVGGSVTLSVIALFVGLILGRTML